MVQEIVRALLTDVETFSRHLLRVPLRPYQLEPARAVLDSVVNRRGLSFSVMMARQAGKNQMVDPHTCAGDAGLEGGGGGGNEDV